MAKVIAVVAQKGGPGKSTVLVNLAAALASISAVGIVDTDPQRSAWTWASLRRRAEELPPVEALRADGVELASAVVRLASSGCEVILVDTPGRDSQEMREALLIADTALVVIAPGVFEVWSAGHAVEVVEAALGLRQRQAAAGQGGAMRAFLLLNRTQNTVISRQIRGALGEVEGAALLDAELGHRVDFQESPGAGQGVTEYNPSGAAARDVRRLIAELQRREGL